MRFQLSFCLLAVLIFLAGCGGGLPADPPPATGVTVRLTISWPVRSRLIPLATSSIEVVATGENGFTASQVGNRPAEGGPSIVQLTALPYGPMTFTVNAYPEADAAGTALAAGVTSVVLSTQLEFIDIVLSSTITSVTITPATGLTVGLGQTLPLTATFRDEGGNMVLVTPSQITWSAEPSTVAGVDNAGVVTGIAPGEATITVTDLESGVSGSVTIQVADLTPTLTDALASPASLSFRGGAVTLRVTAIDDVAVSAVTAGVTAPDDSVTVIPLTRVSGTDQNGAWEGVFTAPGNGTDQPHTYSVQWQALDSINQPATPATESFTVQPPPAPPPPP
ncbi:MAG: Ig-like domain-containing protein [Armatimonadota bacterium]